MVRDLYATVAQVLPVVLLAFVWDSGYLARLHSQQRVLRRQGVAGDVMFWTKGRIRVYALTVSAVIIADLALCVLVLANVVPDVAFVRGVVIAGLSLALVTLLTRVTADILTATAADYQSVDVEPEEVTTPVKNA
ncbi:hypothetical protein [Acrocarpospora catenulata]|uniref:hypothetical protein n=1 Tax=Acrocarpospora catenulata TaxID=2836182 RepID=UPI001BD966ED|nr:hypothetical protein [Acrocarpospora catenulata]